jgi:hypothetical protein
MVQWAHEAYHKLESEREEREAKGELSIFELAFLRTGTLVSANGSSVDGEINPEGIVKAAQESSDRWYKDHNIKEFRDLLRCTGGDCTHDVPELAPVPEVAQADQVSNEKKVQDLLTDLESSEDARAQAIVKCVRHGMAWAGSSFIQFLSKGTGGLLDFLSEEEKKEGDITTLLHDVDLYRTAETTQKIGVRFLKGWRHREQKQTKGSVEKFRLSLAAAPGVMLDIDQVNLAKSSINPSTDIWPNLCLQFVDGQLQVGKLWPDRGPALEPTLHNVLRMGGGAAVPCYVLRKQAMPTYDCEQKFDRDESTSDGRFRGKLHARSTAGLVFLCQHWKPGPHVSPIEFFQKQNGEHGEETASSDSESEAGDWEEPGSDEDTIDSSAVTLAHLRNWEAPLDEDEQFRRDAELARRMTMQSEANPYGESMRNRRPVQRENIPARSLPRRGRFQGSYREQKS